MSWAAIAKTILFSDERAQKGFLWTVAITISPIVMIAVLLSALLSVVADHNTAVVELCFQSESIPESIPEDHRPYILAMRTHFTQLDAAMEMVDDEMEGGDQLDDIRVKAIFYSLYFGADTVPDAESFVDRFVVYEERTRVVETEAEDGTLVEETEIYLVPVPVTNLSQIWSRVSSMTGTAVTTEQQQNAENIYNLIRYGVAADPSEWITGADVPFIGADGFCSPIGVNWERYITSEFGYRNDPFTGKPKGHSGMDLGVPLGTPIRAALDGMVTAASYDPGGYGYYVKLTHDNGLETLYGHCSKLSVRTGESVTAGEIVALSGNSGRSTGPHLHFEIRINGTRANPRAYLPRESITTEGSYDEEN